MYILLRTRRGKLDPQNWLCLFLGYGKDEFGYRLWDLIDKKVIRSRDIIFMEEKTIVDWEMENSPPDADPSRVDG